MRALAKFQSGILRVENPPISSIRIVRDENERQPRLFVKIRFAFDAVRVISNGGRTVRLETKTSKNPQLPTAVATDVSITPPDFSTISSLESQHVKNLEKITVNIYNFDVVKSIPDEAITPLKKGYPIEYAYLLAVPIEQGAFTRETQALSDRDYLISRLESGVDPATLAEVFPMPDPSKKSGRPLVSRDSYYTRPVPSNIGYQKMKLYSSYQVFEQEVEMKVNDFLSSIIYEFSYIDYTGTPIEFVEVKIQPDLIYADLLKLQYSSPTGLIASNDFMQAPPEKVSLSREIISTSSIISTKFIGSESFLRTKRPNVTRVHHKVPGSSLLSIDFSSTVVGLPSKRSKVSSKSNSTKPTVIPFYVSVSGESTSIIVKKLPPRTIRVGILARNVTKGDDSFTQLANVRVNSEVSNSLGVSLPETDCVYEIKLTSTDRKQRTITSSNSVVFNYKRPYKNATLTVSQPVLIGNQRVKFSIGADFTEEGRKDLTNLIEIVSSNNVSTQTLYDAGYTSDPALYSEVFSCIVEKIDLETGEQTYTKELPLGPGTFTFVDRVISQSGAAYVFSLGMRSPSSLLPSQPRYKFGTFGGKYLQSLPSDASAAKNAKSGAPFEKVDSGIKRVIEVKSTTIRGRVSSISVDQTMRNSNLIEWVYDGEISEVDHFQVFGSADGVECLLGCSFRRTAFEDTQLYNRVGVVSYRVRPVYISYEPGDSFSVSLYRRETVPTIVLPTFKNGQTWRQPAITAINTDIKIDRPEISNQQYEDFFNIEIRREARKSATTTQSSSSKKFSSESGLSSVSFAERSPPRTNFNKAPTSESAVISVPASSFRAQSIADSQVAGAQSTNVSLETSASETSSSTSSSAQPISYRRVAR